jgi:mRNA interferase RelE/StbE
MDSFRVELTRSAEKDLRRIERKTLPRIIAALEGLAANPRPAGCRKLSGSKFTYRIRVGNYRVVYELEEGKLIVLVVRIRHRKDAYR